MTSEEFRNELNSGKPLFSIQVDDVLVQEIFQKLAEQIAAQNEEIKYLKEQLANRPTTEEFVRLTEAVQQIQKDYSSSSSILSKTVDSFYSSLEERTKSINDLVQQKVNEMLFSVNAAIRGQIEMLENGPHVAQDTLDTVHNLKLQVARTTQKVEDLKETLIQMAAGFDGSSKVEGLTRKTAPSTVRSAVDKDRKKLAQTNKKLADFEKEFLEFQDTFDTILPVKTRGFPQFIAPPQYNRKSTPEFPKMPAAQTVFDYFDFIAKAMPVVYSVLRELHAYILQIDATVAQKTDRGEFEQYTNETQRLVNSIIDDVEDYRSKKDHLILHEHFEELAQDIYNIVNGASNSAATNTRCIACGKMVQRVAGSIKSPRTTSTARPTSSQSARELTGKTDKTSSRDSELLKLDGLVHETLIDKKTNTARIPKPRPDSSKTSRPK